MKLLLLLIGVLFIPSVTSSNRIRFTNIEDFNAIAHDKRILQANPIITINLGKITLQVSEFYSYMDAPYLVIGDKKYGVYGAAIIKGTPDVKAQLGDTYIDWTGSRGQSWILDALQNTSSNF